MNDIRVDLQELKAAVGEIEARSKDNKVTIKIEERKLVLTATDRSDNGITITLFTDSNLGAQISVTKRLMFLKDEDKKRI